MAEIGRYVRNIERGRDLEYSLSGYGNQMLNVSSRLSAIRFVLNDATFYDTLYEWKENSQAQQFAKDAPETWLPPVLLESVKTLNSLVRVHLQEDSFSGEVLEQQTSGVDALRKQVIRIMSCLTALSDRYTLFEYIVNRKEALYTGAGLPAGYSDDTMTERLMTWLLSDKDLMKLRLTQLIEQLPMRMTKSRFFQILENGLSVYADAEKKTLEDNLDMIRTSVLLKQPDDLQNLFPELDALLGQLEQTDFETLDAEQFHSMQQQMLQCGETLNNLISLTSLLAELVNDLYVQILSSPYALADLSEKNAVDGILRDLLTLFDEGIVRPVPEEVYERFSVLEGKQEMLLESYESGIYELDSILESRESLLQSLMLEKIYRSLRCISKLLSGSLFVSLEQDTDKRELCGKEGVRSAYVQLYQELNSLFAQTPRYRVRAVMAKVLTFLPPFLMTQDELREYIRESLAGCKDMAEKTACVQILGDFLAE